MIPEKLKSGDEIRVIAPSRSLEIISEQTREVAIKRLEDLGFKITYSKNAKEKDDFASSSIKSRVEDLHEAFLNKSVKGILTVVGGFNANQILKYLDYGLIKDNPKVLCGFSDITALSNAIYHKTGLITYSGPHFSTFGMLKGVEYTVEYFKKCLMQKKAFDVLPSKKWSDDPWFLDQDKRKFIKNDGYLLASKGNAEGKILGGNLCTLNLLQGTEYFPDLSNSILFLEDDEETRDVIFDRDLQSLIHQPDFSKVRGIIIGRFQKTSEMTKEKIIKIIQTKEELKNLPIIANADFGHTMPQITFPIGGRIQLTAEENNIHLKITEH